MRGGVVLIAVLAMACNGTTPIAPSAPSPTPPAHGELSGVVTANGAPMAGARVVLWHANNVGVEVAGATTDDTGHYRMSEIEPSSRFGEFVVTSKAGYFREFIHLNITAQSQVATTLTPWDHIVLGTVLSRRVRYDICKGHATGGACDRFAVTPPSAGTLELSSSAFPFDLEVIRPDGLAIAFSYLGPGATAPLQVSTLVDAGLTYEINVYALPGASAREFVMATALR